MSRIAKLVRADVHAHRARFCRARAVRVWQTRLATRTMAGLSVAVVVFGAIGGPAARPAAADPTGSAAGEAQLLQNQVTQAAARVRDLTMAYEQSSTEEAALTAQVTTDQTQIQQIQDQLDATLAVLRNDAILGYTDGSTTPSGLSPNGLSPNGLSPNGLSGIADPSVQAEYLQVAAGDVADTVDAYRSEHARMSDGQTALKAELKAAAAAAAAAAQARQQALSTAADLQARLGQVQAQLAAAPGGARQGPPVGDGLVSVVRNVVSPAPAAAPPANTSSGGAGGVWLQLRECESGDDYQANTGNGFYGAYQFSQATWSNLGYPGRPDLESPGMQDDAAQKLQAEAGWGQWPACAAALGLT